MFADDKKEFHGEAIQILPSMPLNFNVGNNSVVSNRSSSNASLCCGTVSFIPPDFKEKYAVPGYKMECFVTGFVQTDAGQVPLVSTNMNLRDIFATAIVRAGITRNQYRISPGLYATGEPDKNSEVLVTANFKLTFDVLRSSLKGQNLWILVLDTKGVNVWCAAGKGTFSTCELVNRIHASELEKIVSHRRIIVPQLGATGIRAEEVKKQSGFRVIYGPIRAEDIGRFIENGRKADSAMRQVSFNFYERLILTPIEVNCALKPALITAIVIFMISGIGHDLFSFQAALMRGIMPLGFLLAAIVTGAVITPALLPFIPFKSFAPKGIITGSIASAYGLWFAHLFSPELLSSIGKSGMVAVFLFTTAVTSFLSMNFTGATPFTSPSGVEKEMKCFMPFQIIAIVIASILWISSAF
ncbi:CO dehydrogenase/acetyl-CoA synthase gamma subunit (Corrinoid Fe-S protein)-like protein [Desulfamplus magnetovallimortis]|uniref:CO dehydrogenase/acetyl-CoA synthase gamma subunit (Corrinoid Fe-S protein)-like protein n=1 Tax=Desulfamplus magnetovallimortis TaxID=1246637 RepID=A0A1W1HGL1_9BACT|nr:mercury methylation corrinoid protein HgcA [Desulfamplus magnetovallimortis]SLM31576.1 CO dehydrogenase/acetyl-CoA synthase gamma subunit (Corrinoid Fe-S protein)-like protein [Desulfamplus magnetovallimortis]